jgi:hypothetical protein
MLSLTSAGTSFHAMRLRTTSVRTFSGFKPHQESTSAAGAAVITSSSVTGVLLQSRFAKGLTAPTVAIMSVTHECFPGTITGLGHHSTRMDGWIADCVRTRLASERILRTNALPHPQGQGNTLNVRIDIFEAYRAHNQQWHLGGFEGANNSFVTRNCKGSKYEIGPQTNDLFYAYLKIGPDFGHIAHHFGKVIGMAINANQQTFAAQGADDLCV